MSSSSFFDCLRRATGILFNHKFILVTIFIHSNFIMVENLQSLLDLVKSLPAIVEGKRDRAALEHLGFTDIHTLDSPVYKVIERFDKGDTVQILTDLDAEGKRLYARLRHEFAQRGVRIDNRLREALFKTDLSHIEGLDSWLDRQS
jgi:5S rRNA maturation endonuclease (ribonuclease M5)